METGNVTHNASNGLRFIPDCALDRLKPYERNPRLNDAAVDAVERSLGRFGAIAPIIVDSSYRICVGHTRYKAAVERGDKTFPVIVAPQLDDSDLFKGYNIADNQTATIAQWDEPQLASILKELQEADFPVEDIGFDPQELQRLVDSVDMDGTTDVW
jgi:ParB-like chromosome segregation protein Spo0J